MYSINVEVRAIPFCKNKQTFSHLTPSSLNTKPGLKMRHNKCVYDRPIAIANAVVKYYTHTFSTLQTC